MNNIQKMILYLSILTVPFLFLGYFLGGSRGILAVFLSAGILAGWMFGWSDRLVLRLHRAEALQEDSAPEIFSILRELCGPAQIRLPRVYLIPSISANAFATGCGAWNRAIALTQGTLETLNREELKGVLAHELAHLENKDTLLSALASALAGSLSLLAWGIKGMFWVGSARDSKGETANPIVLLAAAISLPLGALFIRLILSKSREYEADKRSGHLCGDPLYLASALAKLEAASKQFPMRRAGPATAHLFILSPLQGKMEALFRTHPPVEERIARLEEMSRSRKG